MMRTHFLTNRHFFIKIITVFIFLFGITDIYSQDSVLLWQDFDTIKEKFKTTQKPIMLFLYSDDDLSNKMFETTFQNSEVNKYLNYLFYNIKFNVKSKESIDFFDGETYLPSSGNDYHNLVRRLYGDSISTPAFIMFNKRAEGTVYYGYKNRDSIFSMLIYYSEEIYNSVDYDVWEKYYFKTYPPGQKQIITHMNIHWQEIPDMLEQNKTNKKLIFIDLYDSYSVSSTVMQLQIYNKPDIAQYLNTHFYRSSVRLRSKNEINIKGFTYKNSGSPYNYHQFVYSILEGKLKFPAFVILDSDLNVIQRVQQFIEPEKFKKIIHYYGDGVYKTEKFDEYIKKN